MRAYYLDLFSPETYEEFSASTRETSGFRQRHRGLAARVKPGDCLVCYVTRVSRFVGLLDVVAGPFLDTTAALAGDPFVVRFRVDPVAWVALQHGVAIHDEEVWNRLSFTRDHPAGSGAWAAKVRGSLGRLDDGDGRFLEERLLDAQRRAIGAVRSRRRD